MSYKSRDVSQKSKSNNVLYLLPKSPWKKKYQYPGRGKVSHPYQNVGMLVSKVAIETIYRAIYKPLIIVME